jgi:hypothetical protein
MKGLVGEGIKVIGSKVSVGGFLLFYDAPAKYYAINTIAFHNRRQRPLASLATIVHTPMPLVKPDKHLQCSYNVRVYICSTICRGSHMIDQKYVTGDAIEKECVYLSLEEKRKDPHITYTSNRAKQLLAVQVWEWRERYLGHAILGQEAARLATMDRCLWIPFEWFMEDAQEQNDGRKRHTSLGASL